LKSIEADLSSNFRSLSEHLREMAANMSKKPLRGSVVFGRELALQPDPSLPANKRRAAMTRELSIAWHRLSESEREVRTCALFAPLQVRSRI
jgi:hypothetical protein